MNAKYVVLGAMVVMTTMIQTAARAATIAERLEQYGASARARWSPHFKQAGVAYPPQQLVLVGLKEEKTLQVYAKSGTNAFHLVRSYPILAASGVAGPKLREGDRQVPEGIYAIELLNPNSRYHLSLRVNYPNAFDRAQASREHRTKLGGDIMIHGKAVSIGCLAMGDEAAEDLFVLAADTELKNITVILSPVDFRASKVVPESANLPEWTKQLYADVKLRLEALPLPKEK
jgi:murein L,D-transpeptidase YafK